MQRKFVKNVYNGGNSSTDKELVFQHMCNHYRRILNAKKTVDTSPPYCYKSRRVSNSNSTNIHSGKTTGVNKPLSRNTSPALTERSVSSNSCKGSRWGTESYTGSSRYHVSCCQETSAPPVRYTCVAMDLVDRIAFDTKNGPAAYCDEGWMEVKAQQKDRRFRGPNENKREANSSPVSSRRLPNAEETGSQQKRKFALQSNKENNSEIPVSCSLEAPKCKCSKICVCDANESDYKKPSENPKEQSQTSSRDSAYNGGVSSLPESRSPTPDQRKKECCCHIRRYFSEKKEKAVKVVNAKEEQPQGAKVPRGGLAPKSSAIDADSSVPPEPAKPKTNDDEKESFRKMKEDGLYVKFIQDITVEVLEKCLYTNKALKKVMRRHMMENMQILDRDRMIEEVENLRIQLGIPEDKTFLNVDADWQDNSSGDAILLYPVISDSEFSLSKNVTSSIEGEHFQERVEEKEISGEGKPNRGIAKSLTALAAEVLPDSNFSDDCDALSIIEVRKAIWEKKNGRSLGNTPMTLSPNRGNSDCESDESFEVKKKHKTPGVRKQFQRNSLSSSESEESGKTFPGMFCHLHKGMKDKNHDMFSFERCNIKRSSSLILDRKNQNVSFRNKKCQICRNSEEKQKATLTCFNKFEVNKEEQTKPRGH